jgi:hypothetical protein
VELDPEDLRRHYAMLSDEALLDVDRSELVEDAQSLYDHQIRQRGLTPEGSADPTGDAEPKPGWLEEAVCAAEFGGMNSALDAENARDVLETAGIPCYLQMQEPDPSADRRRQSQSEFRLLVPGKFNLEAVSVLDKEIFNATIEAEYRTHFEQLSDDELRAVSPTLLLAGLSDRIERLTRAYNEELARRRTE